MRWCGHVGRKRRRTEEIGRRRRGPKITSKARTPNERKVTSQSRQRTPRTPRGALPVRNPTQQVSRLRERRFRVSSDETLSRDESTDDMTAPVTASCPRMDTNPGVMHGVRERVHSVFFFEINGPSCPIAVNFVLLLTASMTAGGTAFYSNGGQKRYNPNAEEDLGAQGPLKIDLPRDSVEGGHEKLIEELTHIVFLNASRPVIVRGANKTSGSVLKAKGTQARSPMKVLIN
ncbi:hypothetical protein HPB48_002775 [Haemaphysalis longicornis]|uniref:Uncharacterized protein n=1 Tax=Haemaphysalis longicornis TaxID=44386 RepID=A0A9J6GEQ4_HAELO|nr:hypothetical protein HPB48_002775 [Haemaphysalis longicornis]